MKNGDSRYLHRLYTQGSVSVTALGLGEEDEEGGASGSRQDPASHTLPMSQEHHL